MATADINRFLIVLGRLSVEAGVLVVLVLVAQWLFRKQLTPRWRCALWLLVVARLVFPFSVASITSVFNLVPHWNQPVFSAPIATGRSTPVAPVPLAQDHPAAVMPQMFSGEKPVPTLTPEPPLATVSAPVSFPPSAPRQPWSWPGCIFSVWLTGVFILAAHITISSVRLSRRSAKMRPVNDPAALAILDQCRSQLKLGANLTLVEGHGISSPALFGVLHPRLLLPSGFTQRFSTSELRFVFLHELAHLKRRDLLLNWLMVIPQVLHWFNPLVWLAFARWRADRELACDAVALEASAGQNEEYGRTILRLLENFTHPIAAPGLVGILEDKRQLRRRIRMIASYVPARSSPRLALVPFVLLILIALTDAQNPSPLPTDGKTKTGVSTATNVDIGTGNPSSSSEASATNAAVSQAPKVPVGMDPGIVVHGRVWDAKTGAPVKLDWVSCRTELFDNFSRHAELILDSEFRLPISAAAFRPGGPYPYRFQLKIEANGYGTLILPPRAFLEGNWETNLTLQPAEVAGRTVLLPNGQPANGAEIWFRPGEDFPRLILGDPNEVRGSYLLKLETDRSGRFSLPTLPEERPVVLTHPEGFLETSLTDLAQTQRVQLQPWAGIEGVLRVDGKPLAGEVVALRSPASGLGAETYMVMCSASTDTNGHFSFTHLPPGGYALSRDRRAHSPFAYEGYQRFHSRLTVESHRLHFDLHAGEVKQLDYSFGGRGIVGHLPVDTQMDWHINTLVLTVSNPPPPYPFDVKNLTPKETEQARRDYFHSPRWLEYDRRQQQFEFVPGEKGYFQTDDVPPGTYELRLRSTDPEKSNPMSPIWAQKPGHEDLLGLLQREVKVPAGTGTLDLGTIKLDLKPSSQKHASTPIEIRNKLAFEADKKRLLTLASNQPLPAVITNGPAMKVTVVDGQTGEPLTGIEILAPNMPPIETGLWKDAPRWLTDQSGEAVIHLGEPSDGHVRRLDRFILTARRQGYSPHSWTWSSETNDVRLTMPGETTIRLARGVIAGGVVCDEQAVPQAGIRVRIYGNDDCRKAEFSSFWNNSAETAAIITDAAGHWQVNDFPADMQAVTIRLIRPDGSIQYFIQKGARSRVRPGFVDLDDLKANRATLVLKAGMDVRGVVLDPFGKPLPNASVIVDDAMVNMTQGAVIASLPGWGIQTDTAGRFELHHHVPGRTTFITYGNGFAATRKTVEVGTNMPEVRLQVGPRQKPAIGPLADP